MADAMTQLERLVERAVERLKSLAAERDELRARVTELEEGLGRLETVQASAGGWESRQGAALAVVAEALAELREGEPGATDDVRGLAG